jgi:hypothetical protein
MGTKTPPRFLPGLSELDFAVLQAIQQARLEEQRDIELRLSMIFDSLEARKRPKPT